MKRVRIVNDGGPSYATKVTDADTGELIEGVMGVEISIGVVPEHVTVKLTIINPVVDIIANAESVGRLL